MNRQFFFVVILATALGGSISITAQGQESRPHTNWFDLVIGTSGDVTTVCNSYQHAWKFGQSKRLTLGIGMRLNGFSANNQFFVTAPAKISKGEAGPGALFKKTIPANMDSVQFGSVSLYAINFMVNIGYSFSDRFSAGFNIDLVGISLGKQKPGTYINGNSPDGITSKPVEGAPTGFNLLLIAENDIGSLNSEFFVAYRLSDHWSIKAGVQHLFMEYSTTTKVQQLPEPNDRFRITPTVACAGVVYTIH